jgi:hypothetical protein
MKYYVIGGMYYTEDAMPKAALVWDMVKEKWVDEELHYEDSTKTTSRHFAEEQLPQAKHKAELSGYISDVFIHEIEE